MAEFDYTAIDIDGGSNTGRIRARDEADARNQLTGLGWTVESITEVDRNDADEPELHRSSKTDFELGKHLAELTAADLPLASGLSILAEEIPRGQTKRALQRVAERLDRGDSLDEALDGPGAPSELRALVEVGVRSGRIGEVLSEYVKQSRKYMELRHKAMYSIGYAAVVGAACIAVLLVFLLILVPQFKSIFIDFNTELPGLTVAVLSLSDTLRTYGILILAVLLILFFLGVRIARAGQWSVWKQRVLRWVPIIGPTLRHMTLARFTRMLSLLVENNTPLPEAVRLAARATNDDAMEIDVEQLAQQLETRGPDDLPFAVASRFPPSLIQVFTAVGRRPNLGQTLSTLADDYENRSEVRVIALAPVLEPVVILITGWTIAWFVIAMFLPLMSLLNDLS
ncbi:type II secretion system F family protein [Thalassoroseus pseudoceratinae]|uniref:type II secretion system F family protein n=1 Tax=Thalassoroseus pseudoceratinae TaxID=2713176 RepID=UPI00142249B7|nr:type II secretion system F family protein [Thalassoroseus pseudoceratinae]